MAEGTHRYVGDHPQEVMVNGESVSLEPGQFVTPDPLDPVTTDLLASGALMDVSKIPADVTTAPTTSALTSLGSGDK